MSQLGQGLMEGASFVHGIQDQHAKRKQDKLDSASREAAAGAIPGEAPAPAPAKPSILDRAMDIPGDLTSMIHGFYDKLRGRSLNDNHTPNDEAAAAPPIPVEQGATAAAAQAAATDPSANAGIPQQTPAQSGKKKHSLTREDDDELDERIMNATRAAALAGHNPAEVFQSLNAVKTAHYQGNILKNLNAAGVALQRGDSKAVEQALKNVYYYFPDGDELTFKHDADGRMLYQDPFNPQKEDGSDNLIPVDAAHLQMLGLAAVDSTKLNDAITGAKTAAVARQAKLATAQAAIENAAANTSNASSREREVSAKEKLIPSQIYTNVAKGGYDEARANIDELRLKVALKRGSAGLPKAAQGAANDAAKHVYELFQGQPETVPVTDKDGNTNYSPAAGKTTRNPDKVPTWLKGKSPDQLADIAGLAGSIAAANLGSIPKDEAVMLAARLSDSRGKTHPVDTGSGYAADSQVSKDGNFVDLWQGKSSDGKDLGYRRFRLTTEIGSSLGSGAQILPGEEPDEGGDPVLGGEDDADPGYNPNDPNDDPSYHVPAVK